MGSTDTFTIDDIKKLKRALKQYKKYKLKPIYIHADSAMGGFYSFFNNYSFEENSLSFEPNVKMPYNTYKIKCNICPLQTVYVLIFIN